ncbi:hypothetical protein CU043_02145 [Corynebacterium striatum]|nr:hypothetical protein [Corynebacterium striatum]
MKKTLSSLILIAPLILTACGGGNSQPADESTEALAVPEFRTTTEAGVDVSDTLPDESAWNCDPRVVQTSDGPIALKNFTMKGNEAVFYFAPNSNEYNSYSYRLDFENGIMVMEDNAAGSFDSFVQVYPSTDEEEVFVGLGSTYLTASFEVPANDVDRLGKLKGAYASVNGELAGSCSADK